MISLARVQAIQVDMMAAIRHFHVAIAMSSQHHSPFHKGQEYIVGYWLNEYIKCWDRIEALGLIFEINLPPVPGIRWDDGDCFEEPKRGSV